MESAENGSIIKQIIMYSYLKTIKKVIIRLLIFGFPIVLELAPEAWLNLTIGGLITFLYDWVKNYAGVKLP